LQTCLSADHPKNPVLMSSAARKMKTAQTSLHQYDYFGLKGATHFGANSATHFGVKSASRFGAKGATYFGAKSATF